MSGTPARPYRGRFAPSPTGPLHFGSLVAALASYADALAAGGAWIVRIEDVDLPRTRRGAEAAILATLDRYGFAWDGPAVRQSERTALYEAALARLIDAGVAYPCACTRRELEAVPVGPVGERMYPGTCRGGIPARHLLRTQRAWRVRVDTGACAAAISYSDRLHGPQVQVLPRDVGDFVVKRADGLFAYQLAVVVDDDAQGITDIVRGADLCTSTPRQICLQRRLGLPTPTYLHVPVAVNAAGQKLSKETHAAALPSTPLPVLLAAWRFLRQAEPEAAWKPASVAEFWGWAAHGWSASRLPPLPTLAATGVAGREAAAAV